MQPIAKKHQISNSNTPTKSFEKYASITWEEALDVLEVSSEDGLTSNQAAERRHKYGLNRIVVAKPKSSWKIFVDQLKNYILALLVAAAVASFAFGQWLEGAAIIAALVINVLIGFFTELKATRSMEALRSMSRVTSKVVRDSDAVEISSDRLVPGDIVVLESGDIVSADLRLIEASRMEVNESALTGESVPVSKQTDPVPEDAPLAETNNMVFKGTAITSGSGRGIVVGIGMNTELGRISSLVEEAEDELTPLEKRLARLANKLVWATLAVSAVVFVLGLLARRELLLVIETAVALAVAAVPEGLPIVATVALARGMWRMSRRNALMNKLSSVETLGSIDTVCTDKTGTLTENRMTVTRIGIPKDKGSAIQNIEVLEQAESEKSSRINGDQFAASDIPVLSDALKICVLCNNAYLKGKENDNGAKSIGEPLEIALLEVGLKAGLRRDELLDSLPEVREDSFDPELKMMATIHEDSPGYYIAVKGAPEAVLEHCSHVATSNNRVPITPEIREEWAEHNKRMAEEGLRVLGLAAKTTDSVDDNPYEGLTLLALAGMLDPPRKEVKTSIETLRKAGIRVVMVTGDQPVTARHIGMAVGLSESYNDQVVHGSDLAESEGMTEVEQEKLLKAPIFSRVTPEQKLDLVTYLQKNGSIVAMTGDGVNDAPALKKADVGVAMGLRGTQVAKEASDVVLKDDAFTTITAAVEQGRAIFHNIRRFVIYLLSGNVAEILIVSFAFVAGTPLPILPLQILYLNMIGDVFPALALGVGKGESSVMRKPPRDPLEAIVTNSHWGEIVGYGILLAAFVLVAFFLAISWFHMNPEHAVTISFLTVSFARVFHTFNMKDWGAKVLINDVTRNLYVWGALLLCSGLLLMAIYVPFLAKVLHLKPPSAEGWGLIVTMSILPLLLLQIVKSPLIARLFGHKSIEAYEEK